MRALRCLFVICLLGWGSAYAQTKLPTCQGSNDTSACYGTLNFPNGARYEGEFKDGIRFGRGIEFDYRGNTFRDGYWLDWQFSVSPISLPAPTKLPLTLLNSEISIPTAKAKCAEIGFAPGTEGFGKCVLQLTK